MANLTVLQRDQLTTRLYNEYYEIDRKGDNLFTKDRQEYQRLAKIYVEKGLQNVIYEFHQNGKDSRKKR